jgi:RPA family protein
MHFEFFSPVKDQDNPDAKSSLSTHRSERKPEAVEIFGKPYSFRGGDKPILCTIRAEPLKKKENTYFSLSYIEASESLQAIRLFVNIEESGTVLLDFRAINDNKLINFFEHLNTKAQEVHVMTKTQSTQATYLYTYKGNLENMKQMFPILETYLMKHRFCNHGKDYTLTPLFALFENLYTTVEQNFITQQQTKAAKNLSGISIHTISR